VKDALMRVSDDLNEEAKTWNEKVMSTHLSIDSARRNIERFTSARDAAQARVDDARKV